MNPRSVRKVTATPVAGRKNSHKERRRVAPTARRGLSSYRKAHGSDGLRARGAVGAAMDVPLASAPLQKTGPTIADKCFDAMVRHNAQQKGLAVETKSGTSTAPLPAGGGRRDGIRHPSNPPEEGDILWGARRIAEWLFRAGSNAGRRRVFNMWDAAQEERRQGKDSIPLFKIGGTLCLSKSEFAAWVKNLIKPKKD